MTVMREHSIFCLVLVVYCILLAWIFGIGILVHENPVRGLFSLQLLSEFFFTTTRPAGKNFAGSFCGSLAHCSETFLCGVSRLCVGLSVTHFFVFFPCRRGDFPVGRVRVRTCVTFGAEVTLHWELGAKLFKNNRSSSSAHNNLVWLSGVCEEVII
jgi:hypothetical protein